MLILTETTDTLQIILAGAITTNHLQAYATWRDITASAFTPGRSVGVSNNTTAVNLVTSPASSTQRVIDTVIVRNTDTVNATLTIRFNANGTTYELWKGSLRPDERIEYSDGTGFRLFGAEGSERILTVQSYASPTVNTLNTVVLASNVVNDNAVANTLEDVTGLLFPVVTGQKYWFRAAIEYTAAVGTTGSRWTITGPSANTVTVRYTATLSVSTQTNVTNNAYDLPAAASAASLAAGNIAVVEGFIDAAADGDVQIRFASEVANSAITALAGSILQWMRVI